MGLALTKLQNDHAKNIGELVSRGWFVSTCVLRVRPLFDDYVFISLKLIACRIYVFLSSLFYGSKFA